MREQDSYPVLVAVASKENIVIYSIIVNVFKSSVAVGNVSLFALALLCEIYLYTYIPVISA